MQFADNAGLDRAFAHGDLVLRYPLTVSKDTAVNFDEQCPGQTA